MKQAPPRLPKSPRQKVIKHLKNKSSMRVMILIHEILKRPHF